jgi:hypothetical protein
VFFGAANVLGAIVGATKLVFSLALISALLFGGYALFMWRVEQMAHPHHAWEDAPIIVPAPTQPPLLSDKDVGIVTPSQHDTACAWVKLNPSTTECR